MRVSGIPYVSYNNLGNLLQQHFLGVLGLVSCLVCAHIFGLSAIHRSVSRNSFDSGENF